MGFISQKTAIFVVTAVETSNRMHFYLPYVGMELGLNEVQNVCLGRL
jgi:hypothetical protein